MRIHLKQRIAAAVSAIALIAGLGIVAAASAAPAVAAPVSPVAGTHVVKDTRPKVAVPFCGGATSWNLNYNHSWFWNNWNGTVANGNNINYNNVHNDGYNDWCVDEINVVKGTNCTGNQCEPFAPGSGLNARYDGRPVWIICWAHNDNYCIDFGQYDTGVHNGRAILHAGTADARLEEVVQSSSNFWVPVWPNDLEFAANGMGPLPVLLGTKNNGPITQGGGVWMNFDGEGLQFNKTVSEVCNIHC